MKGKKTLGEWERILNGNDKIGRKARADYDKLWDDITTPLKRNKSKSNKQRK